MLEPRSERVQNEPLSGRAAVLVLGLGNPILGDDGVGWRVAEAVEVAAADRGLAIDVDYASVGGLRLMERMLGYRRVILIDSMWSGDRPLGSIRAFELKDLPHPEAGHTSSAHDTSLATALDAARAIHAEVPDEVQVVAVETPACYDFAETLTPAAEAAKPIATRKVLELLGLAV